MGTVNYHWQCEKNSLNVCSVPGPTANWGNITGATGRNYRIADTSPQDKRFRIIATYTDMQGYSTTIESRSITFTESDALKIRSKVFLEGPLQ